LKEASNIMSDNFKWAKELAAWKHKVSLVWNEIEIKKQKSPMD
jgi:glycogen phosphorylase